MEPLFYSIKDLAPILKLHPKTILRFIKEGRIRARKIGRSWMVHQDDLKGYVHAELAGREPGRAVRPESSAPSRITVSAVVEISEQGSDEASRLSNSLLALLNGRDDGMGPSRYDFFYYPETGKAKHLFYGTPAFIAEILKVFETLCTPEGSDG